MCFCMTDLFLTESASGCHVAYFVRLHWCFQLALRCANRCIFLQAAFLAGFKLTPKGHFLGVLTHLETCPGGFLCVPTHGQFRSHGQSRAVGSMFVLPARPGSRFCLATCMNMGVLKTGEPLKAQSCVCSFSEASLQQGYPQKRHPHDATLLQPASLEQYLS